MFWAFSQRYRCWEISQKTKYILKSIKIWNDLYQDRRFWSFSPDLAKGHESQPETPVKKQSHVLHVFWDVFPLTLVGVVLWFELLLFGLQLQKLHLHLQILLLRFQRILKFNEFLKGGDGNNTFINCTEDDYIACWFNMERNTRLRLRLLCFWLIDSMFCNNRIVESQ